MSREQPWFRLEGVCYPCYDGEHDACRHRPDGPRFGRAAEGTPCLCEQHEHAGGAGTCSDHRTENYASYRCGRPAKGTVTIRGSFRSEGRSETVEVERCGIHLAGLRKRAEHEARRAAERAQEEADERSAEQMEAASAEWARRLREELGIVADPVQYQGKATKLRVIVQPERLHGQITELLDLLREVGIEDHPFQPKETT